MATGVGRSSNLRSGCVWDLILGLASDVGAYENATEDGKGSRCRSLGRRSELGKMGGVDNRRRTGKEEEKQIN
uniref:Uncharacterized protein n=1 Tax=Cannabis sativa TaxID=3483 RepID=A0A803PH35_CANSA